MKVAIVTYASECFRFPLANTYKYFQYAERLKQSLINLNFEGDFYLFTEENLKSPKHKDKHYAFKPIAINELKDKYDIVIWADSILIAKQSLTELIKHIEENGYVFFDNIGYTIGDYTSDVCLNNYEMNRDESFNYPMIMACLMGFDFRNKIACEIFDEYYKALHRFGNYEGDWSNHRHDQSVMSIILAKKEIKPIHPHSTFFAYDDNPGHQPQAESVCFISKEM